MRAAWLIGIALAACGSASPTAGRERAACRDDGTCLPGLQCLSKVCVAPTGDGCDQVGQRAAALLTEEARRRPLLGAALGSMPARIGDLLAAACRDDGWSRAAQRCVVDAKDHDRVEACLADLPPRPRAALARRQAALGSSALIEDDRDVAIAPPPLDPDPRPWNSPPAGADDPDDPDDVDDPFDPDDVVDPLDPLAPSAADRLGPACESYLALLARYARCPTMPAPTRRSLAEAVVTVRRSFSQVPGGSRALLEDGCRHGASSMRDALTSLGCP